MAQKIDISLLKDTYSRLSNAELASFLVSNVSGLTSESLELLEREVISRNLDKQLLAVIENRRQSDLELDFLCNLIRHLTCPICQQANKKINAAVVSETISIVILTHHKKRTILGCPDCLRKANNSALITTVFIGWWGIPWGIIRSVESISSYFFARQSIVGGEISDGLRRFVIEHFEYISLYKDDPSNLYEICLSWNKEANKD